MTPLARQAAELMQASQTDALACRALRWEQAGPLTEADDLLDAVVQDYVEDVGIWGLIAYPGVYDILKIAFAEAVEEKRRVWADWATYEARVLPTGDPV